MKVSLIRWGAVLFILLLWDAAVRVKLVDSLILAPPLTTAASFLSGWKLSLPHLKATLVQFGIAFGVAVVSGVAVGLAVGISQRSYGLLSPLILLGVIVPKVVLLHLIILWFGIGRGAIVAFGLLSGFFPIAVNTMAGVREVKPSYITAARAFGCSTLQIFRKVVVPGMLPVLSSGLFLGSVGVMTGVFIMEMIMARTGIGALIFSLAINFRPGELYAVVLITASVTLAINGSLWLLSRELGKWRG